jgi:flagellar motor switch protein FliM
MIPPEDVDAEGMGDQQEGMLEDIPIRVSIELAEKTMTVDRVTRLRVGQVIELNRLPGDLVALRASGDTIAKGELVNIEGQLGVRILKFTRK